MHPQTRYARSGGVNIAYQAVGDGPLDLVMVAGWISNLEGGWEQVEHARFLQELAAFSRLILFDKRGTGLSDRVDEGDLPSLEQRMDDLRAVLDAAGSERAALFGFSEGGPMSALFAATYPERTSALVMYGSYPKWIREADYPWAPTREDHERAFRAFAERWGEPVGLHIMAPSMASDERFQNDWAASLRRGASPGAAIALYRMNIEIDIRPVLPSIRVPTLILHRSGDRLISVENARYMARSIPGARRVELEGIDHLPWVGDAPAIVAEVREFLTGVRPVREDDRVLATVLFVDVVDSTERAADLGDRRWADLLGSYQSTVRREIARFRGREIDCTGDGFFASFDGPARAVRCACLLRETVGRMGLLIRAGLHTGECERLGEKLGGIAVHTGARLAAAAEPGEVLVSNTVKDLVAGSGLRFTERGTRTLKGVPGEWLLYAAQA